MTGSNILPLGRGGPDQPGRSPRVLVIDDEALVRAMLARYLPRIGYDAVAIRSSREACALLAEETWNAVVMSLSLVHGTPEKRFVVFREPDGTSPPPMPRVLTTPFRLEEIGEALQQVGAGTCRPRNRMAATA